jgi:putative phage-type endonuclease
MNRTEWLEVRRKTIGASDAPIILGISPWSSPHDIWISKMGMDATEETQAMRLGHYLQSGVAMEALHQIGGSILSEEDFAVHPNGWASATPDYVIRQDDDNVILEIKCTHEKSWDTVPEHYLLQVHWQCWVHGIDRAYIAVLHGSSQVKVYELQIDLFSDWFVDSVAHVKAWFDNHVSDAEEPAIEQKRNDALKAAIRAASGTSVDLSEEIIDKMRRIAQIKRETAPATDELSALEREVKEAIGTAEVGLYQGKTVVTYKETVSKRFDTKKFQADRPDIAKDYLSETVSRRFLLKDDLILSLTEVTA